MRKLIVLQISISVPTLFTFKELIAFFLKLSLVNELNFLSREFLIKSKDFKKRRYLINISSISGKLITSQSPSYNITKAALLHMSNYLATLGKEYNCNINAILPGLIIQKRQY